MGLYETLILPRLIELAMRNKRLAGYRQETIGAACGLVLEIGVGSGLNLPLYGPAVDRVCGIDPSTELLRLAAARSADARVPVSLVQASAERLAFGSRRSKPATCKAQSRGPSCIGGGCGPDV